MAKPINKLFFCHNIIYYNTHVNKRLLEKIQRSQNAFSRKGSCPHEPQGTIHFEGIEPGFKVFKKFVFLGGVRICARPILIGNKKGDAHPLMLMRIPFQMPIHLDLSSIRS